MIMNKKIDLFLLSIIILTASLVCYAQRQEMPTNKNDVSGTAKEFVELLAKEDFLSAVKNFDNTMTAVFTPEKLEYSWKTLISQIGSFKREVGVRINKFNEYDIAFVTCEFEKSVLDIKVVFNSAKQIAGLFFVPSESFKMKEEPPVSSTEDSLREKQVLVGTGDWALHGTLTLPEGSGPFPAVVLVHGSGPNDRDETIGPNKPFRDLAQGLTSRGIAVLRYNKRTKEYSAQLASIKDSITVNEETIDDAIYAVSLLRKTERINPKKIFILGHSLGGMLIPRIGAIDSNITGFIVMAGTSRPLEDVILEQVLYISSLDSTMSEINKKQLDKLELQVGKVKDPSLSVATPSTDLPFGVSAKYWLNLRGYNPPEAAKNLKQPILILQGERDYQVTIQDFDGWKKALAARRNVEFKLYPKLNHLFIKGEGKSTPSDYGIAGHVAEIVIDDIGTWIKNQ
jgi:dienelactone hydrolase